MLLIIMSKLISDILIFFVSFFLQTELCSNVNIQFITLRVNSLGLKYTQNINCSISSEEERSPDQHLWTNTKNIIIQKTNNVNNIVVHILDGL